MTNQEMFDYVKKTLYHFPLTNQQAKELIPYIVSHLDDTDIIELYRVLIEEKFKDYVQDNHRMKIEIEQMPVRLDNYYDALSVIPHFRETYQGEGIWLDKREIINDGWRY